MACVGRTKRTHLSANRTHANLSERQTKSNTIIESNNYLQHYGSVRMCDEDVRSADSASQQSATMSMRISRESVFLIFIKEFVCTQWMRWWPVSTIVCLLYLLSTINNLFERNLFNTEKQCRLQRVHSVCVCVCADSSEQFSRNERIRTFHRLHFRIYHLIRCQPRRPPVASVDKIISLHRKKTHTYTSEALARTSSDWQISLEIAYVIMASFGWIFILFSYDFQSLDKCETVGAPSYSFALLRAVFFILTLSSPSKLFVCAQIVAQSVVILRWICSSRRHRIFRLFDLQRRVHENVQTPKMTHFGCWFLIKTHFRLSQVHCKRECKAVLNRMASIVRFWECFEHSRRSYDHLISPVKYLCKLSIFRSKIH